MKSLYFRQTIMSSEKVNVCDDEVETITTRQDRKRYPYGPVFFLLGATVGQGYVSSGLQAVLELYFVRFLLVCFERKTSLATTSTNVYIALYQVCAISAGILADKIIGNYLTQVFSVFLTTSGIFLLTLSTWQYTISEPQCCYHSSSNMSLQVPLTTQSYWSSNCTELHKHFILSGMDLHISPTSGLVLASIGLILYAIGYGHINTVQSVFVADQFVEESTEKRRSFSWYYLCCNLGSLGGESGLPILRQSLGFVIAWLTLLGSTSFSTLFFLCGTCLYVKYLPDNSCVRSCQLCGEGNSKMPASVNAEERKPLLGARKDSYCCSMLLVLKQLLPFLGVFGPLIVFWAVFYQQNTTWVVQGTHMNCYLGKLHVPPDMMPSINDFLVILIIPFLEYVVYPHLEHTMGITVQPLHKMVTGMLSAVLSFLMSGLLQLYVSHYRYDNCQGDVNLMWQLPQVFLISVAEVMVCVTGLEFAYSQAPHKYRNVVTAMWYLSQALGTLLNAGVAQIGQINLLIQFLLYMALLFLVTIIFIIVNRKFKYANATSKQNQHEPFSGQHIFTA